jgi:hypothetical protein
MAGKITLTLTNVEAGGVLAALDHYLSDASAAAEQAEKDETALPEDHPTPRLIAGAMRAAAMIRRLLKANAYQSGSI